MAINSIRLDGCAPTPLASYLKALGILRLISSDANHVDGRAADPYARGCWEDEHFNLRTRLSRDELIEFFLHKYAPSPIIAPWNGGSGFYPKDNKDGLEPLAEGTVGKRFNAIASAIRAATRTIETRGLTKRPAGADKSELVSALRSELPSAALDWVDAALAISGKMLAYPQLLGTGGNDGRLDFTNNFMRRLVSKKKPHIGIFDAASGMPTDQAIHLLANALENSPSQGLSTVAVGQFAPGAAGGPNSATGYEGGGVVNPWDFVLMLEGGPAFSGAATRRHQSMSRSGASFPFTVRTTCAGWGGMDTADENDARAEFWAPLWKRPARYREVRALLSEGRAVLNSKTVRDGLEFARATASLGVSRGFSEFARYGFLMRAGKAYLAAPLGRRSVDPSPYARLVADLDRGGWLDRLRRFDRSGAPATARTAIRRMEDALFDLLAPSAPPECIQRALIALGHITDWLSVSVEGRERVRTPPPSLSPAWIRAADDASPEFRIAVALAGIGLQRRNSHQDPSGRSATPPTNGLADAAMAFKSLPMASHFAPVERDTFGRGWRHSWSSKSSNPEVVWGKRDLVSNMVAVLERRVVDASMNSLPDKPLAGATYASLYDVAAFLMNDFDDARCADLLAGLVWAHPGATRKATKRAPTVVPFAYAALKPIFTPDPVLRRVGFLAETGRLPISLELLPRLRAGGSSRDGYAINEAVRVALTRTRGSGVTSPFDVARSGGRLASGEKSRFGAGLHADRMAASMLIPVSDRALKSLCSRVYPGSASKQSVEYQEDTTDVA